MHATIAGDAVALNGRPEPGTIMNMRIREHVFGRLRKRAESKARGFTNGPVRAVEVRVCVFLQSVRQRIDRHPLAPTDRPTDIHIGAHGNTHATQNKKTEPRQEHARRETHNEREREPAHERVGSEKIEFFTKGGT